MYGGYLAQLRHIINDIWLVGIRRGNGTEGRGGGRASEPRAVMVSHDTNRAAYLVGSCIYVYYYYI